jgi:N-methylhydantoinase A
MDSFKRQGLEREKTFFYPSLDLRYRGQSFHLTVDYDGPADLADRFHQTFESRYGYCLRDIPIEIVSVKLLAIADRPYTMPITDPGRTRKRPAQTREVLLPSGRRTAGVYKRHTLSDGFIEGPAIVEDEGCTIFIPLHCEVSRAEKGCLKIAIA